MPFYCQNLGLKYTSFSQKMCFWLFIGLFEYMFCFRIIFKWRTWSKTLYLVNFWWNELVHANFQLTFVLKTWSLTSGNWCNILNLFDLWINQLIDASIWPNFGLKILNCSIWRTIISYVPANICYSLHLFFSI